MRKPESLIRYKTFKDLFATYMCVPPQIINPNDNISFNGVEQTFKDLEKQIRKQRVWGFVRDEVIHYWMLESLSFKALAMFLSHELGHLNGHHYADSKKEEAKAINYEEITQYSIELANKIKRRKK
jgi:hypothetical protein